MVVAVEYISKEESAGVEAAKHGVTGILAVQGAFAEHAAMLDRLGAPWKLLRAAEDFDDSIDRVILPGGESTTQGKLLRSTGLFEPIAEHIAAGKPVFGTCAGMILLARKLDNDDNVYFGALDAVVRRNAYGRQLGSFPRRFRLLFRRFHRRGRTGRACSARRPGRHRAQGFPAGVHPRAVRGRSRTGRHRRNIGG